MFKKKSTKELVKGSSSADKLPEASQSKPKKKKAKAPGTPGKLAFFRTKFFYGLVAIVAGISFSLIGVPAFRNSVAETVEVVCFTKEVKSGAQITRDMLTTVELSAYHLPSGALSDMEPLLGQYLLVDAITGDFATGNRFSPQHPGKDPVLLDLPEGKMAMSISLPSLAQSVSGKLRSGDVIQIFSVANSGSAAVASAPPELCYVEVLTATYSDGVDVNDETAAEGSSNASGSDTLAAVTLLVNEQQAVCLAGLEQSAVLHTALVVRGNDSRKVEVLAMQEAVFETPVSVDTEPPAVPNTDILLDIPLSEEAD